MNSGCIFETRAFVLFLHLSLFLQVRMFTVEGASYV